MKWMLVVVIGGVSPVQTDVIFDKLSDCLAAEEQLRKAYLDALEVWEKRAAITFERRRDYSKARALQARRFDNSGTCIPHAGGDPVASSRIGATTIAFLRSSRYVSGWRAFSTASEK